MESRDFMIIFADDLRRSSLLVKRCGLAHVGSALGGLSGRRRAHATVWTPGCVDLRRSTSISARTHHVRRRGPHRASSLYPPHARSWLGPARHLALTSIPCLPKPPSARLLARLIGLP